MVVRFGWAGAVVGGGGGFEFTVLLFNMLSTFVVATYSSGGDPSGPSRKRGTLPMGRMDLDQGATCKGS